LVEILKMNNMEKEEKEKEEILNKITMDSK
jgi:hypothetical protein